MSEQEQVFRESLLAVFEAMFFESLKAEPFETVELPEHAMCAKVDFTGSHAGGMQVALRPETAATLAGNLLGLGKGDTAGDAALEEALEQSTLGELANICCGSFLSRFDRRGSFSIRPPEVSVEAPEPDQRTWLAMPMGGGTAYFRLQWKEVP
jgi:chemotaxis protein CheY-P-specific phosphatase CheC